MMSTNMEVVNEQSHSTNLIKYKEALRILNISATTFYKYVREGKLPRAIEICGVKQWDRSEILAYIESQRAAANK